mmetsp:Transcript_31025/g.29631  ORF Transcript_31025/g.29631 Transcript_31025/m.29631 type:complete len:444 (-) Transcript_31025:117-1448(-)
MYRIVIYVFFLVIIVCKGHQLEWTTSDFVSNAINLSRNAMAAIEKSIAIPPDDVTILHIVDALSIKRLYRIVSASSQLTKCKHIVLYWIPGKGRSRTALQDIATLNALLPAETIRVIDFQHFHDSEQAYMSNNCSRSELHTLLAAEYHRMESNTDNTKGTNLLYWLLDIDVDWIGDISLILNKLSPPPVFSPPFITSLLSGIEGIESFIDTRTTDYLYVGISHVGRNTTYSSTETIHKVKLKFDEIKNAYDQKLNDLDQFVNGTFEAIINLLNLKNSQSLRNKTMITIEKKEDPFYWPEIIRFSGKFLDIIRNTTFSLIHSSNKSQILYWELIDNNKLKTHDTLEYGLKEGLLARDFIVHTTVGLESNYSDNTNNCKEILKKQKRKLKDDEFGEQSLFSSVNNKSCVYENEFELLKSQFLKSQKLFPFENKAGTIFRNVIESK